VVVPDVVVVVLSDVDVEVLSRPVPPLGVVVEEVVFVVSVGLVVLSIPWPPVGVVVVGVE
jgi:hypothetical protein